MVRFLLALSALMSSAAATDVGHVNNGLVWLESSGDIQTLFQNWIKDRDIIFQEDATQGEEEYLCKAFWIKRMSNRVTFASCDTYDYLSLLSQNNKAPLDGFINLMILKRLTKKTVRSTEEKDRLKTLYNQYVADPEDMDQPEVENLRKKGTC